MNYYGSQCKKYSAKFLSNHPEIDIRYVSSSFSLKDSDVKDYKESESGKTMLIIWILHISHFK